MHFCPPPSWFRPAGEVAEAHFDATGPGFGPRRATGRRWEGLKYERKALARLYERYPGRLVWSPWIRFRNPAGSWRWCQPDGLLIDVEAGQVVVLEVKHHHTSDAWWQLEKLYRPVVQRMLPEQLWRLAVVEVVRWYDPAVLFPCPLVLVEDPAQSPRGKFGVHIIGRSDG